VAILAAPKVQRCLVHCGWTDDGAASLAAWAKSGFPIEGRNVTTLSRAPVMVDAASAARRVEPEVGGA
jgi:hypothetical protein